MSNVQTKKEALLEEVLGDAHELIEKVERLGKEIPQDIARVKVVIDDSVRRAGEVLEVASKKHEKGLSESLFVLQMLSKEIEAGVVDMKKELRRAYWYVPCGTVLMFILMMIYNIMSKI